MNNLTQTQFDAKQSYLRERQENMLALYQKVGVSERNAIIKQINSFLSIVSQDEKTFWMSFRRKLEVLNEMTVLFPLGEVLLTIGAREALEESKEQPFDFLLRHQSGDYGIIGKDDWRENDLSVQEGFRILSAYKTAKNVKIWCITEADRSSSTVLLPSEY